MEGWPLCSWTLHSIVGPDLPWELDTNTSSNFNPQTKCAKVACATADHFTLTMCRERVLVEGLTPLTGYPPSMLPCGVQTYCLECGLLYLLVASQQCNQKMSSAPHCKANKHVQKKHFNCLQLGEVWILSSTPTCTRNVTLPQWRVTG